MYYHISYADQTADQLGGGARGVNGAAYMGLIFC